MDIRTPVLVGLLSLGSLLAAFPTPSAAAPAANPLAKALKSISKQDTIGHPDLQGEYDGIRAYAHGHYDTAMQAFRRGARYADKLSQLCIGLMYLNGNGVDVEPARAWAWFAIAAQRDYPGFDQTRDHVWSSLSPAQRKRAVAIRNKLLPVYGDAVAKRRMRAALEHARSHMAGWLTGKPPGDESCATPAGSRHNCDDVYAAWRWEPKQYFKVRDALYRGTVTVGQLHQQQDDGGH